MPGNKRPNRKKGGKKSAKGAAAEAAQGGPAEAGDTVKGMKTAAKTYGTPKSSRSLISPAQNRGSARSR
jgi:hypothetical protein